MSWKSGFFILFINNMLLTLILNISLFIDVVAPACFLNVDVGCL